MVLKYEIENFKTQPVTLDVVENLRHIRNEVRGDTGRDVEWELGNDTTFEGGPDKEKSTFEQLMFHVKLPAARRRRQGREDHAQAARQLKNEW